MRLAWIRKLLPASPAPAANGSLRSKKENPQLPSASCFEPSEYLVYGCKAWTLRPKRVLVLQGHRRST